MKLPSSVAISPLSYSRQVLARVRELTDTAVVAFSGGKDSIATLDLIMRYGNFERVEGFYCYLVKDISFVERRLQWAEEHYGITIHRYPHPDLSRLLKHNAFRKPSKIGADIRMLRFSDVDKVVRFDTGIPWLAYGWKRVDSLDRIGALADLELNAIDTKGPRFYPISRWSQKQVLAYIKHNKLMRPETFGGRKMTGVSLMPADLSALREYHPNDYEKVRAVFPYADAIVARYHEQVRIKKAKKQALITTEVEDHVEEQE